MSRGQQTDIVLFLILPRKFCDSGANVSQGWRMAWPIKFVLIAVSEHCKLGSLSFKKWDHFETWPGFYVKKKNPFLQPILEPPRAAECESWLLCCLLCFANSFYLLDDIFFCSFSVSHFFPRSHSLSSFRHFNQPFLITDTLSVTLCSFTCHLWEMEPWSRRQKTRSCVSLGCWNRPGNSMDMMPGTLLDCQLASPMVPARSLLNTVLINGIIYFFCLNS